ncbi:MAG: PEP-CTERM sorting domain-containing protein [Candidatus Electrothrix sp. AX5]|nr:PEP-CTERM sorting domain-containing protein [Candidatus Electrothrix sp. AX5]
MKKNILMMATVCMLAAPLSAGAYMVDGTRVDLTSHEGLSGGSWVEVTGDGTNQVRFDLGLADGTIADMRSFSFNIDGEITVDQLSYTVNSLVDENNDFTIDDVITNWPTVSKSADLQGTKIEFGFGAEFGDAGIGVGGGDIRAISMTFSVDSPLFLDIDESNFGMRLMSFDEGDGNRDGSRKMIGGYDGTPPPPASVPEPASALMIGLGLIGLAGFRKRNQRQK